MLTRTWELGQSYGELSVNVELEQTGDYISWPAGRQPGNDGLVTIPVTFAARSLTATLTLETVDDEVSEADGSVTAAILADAGGSYATGADSDHTTKLVDNDPPIISVEAVSAEVTEGTDAQFRFSRVGDTGVVTRVGLWVGGLPKIMTDATEATVLTSQDNTVWIYGAAVDYILEFAADETEKTLSLTTEADSVNEGDGWLGVRIVQRVANPFSIGTGYAQVHVHDDDVPTVSFSQVTLPTGAATLEGDTWVGDMPEGQAVSWVVSCSGNYDYSPLPHNPSVIGLPVEVEHIRLANHPAYYHETIGSLLGNNQLVFVLGGRCDGQARTSGARRRLVGPDGGVETFKLVPKDREPPIVAEYEEAYRQAKAAADEAGTLITQHDIIHEAVVTPPHGLLVACYDEPRYCPQYRVGTPHTIRLTLVNRDPTILIKAESTTVEEGQPARFIVERLWAQDLLNGFGSLSETVVALRASQNGQYITGALPTAITFGQNETSKIIQLTTVDDSAFGADGSVTIELLPDTTGADLNVQGKYETFEHWSGHTPEGARSDRATIAITNNDDKPGISIAPASALEGDSGSANMTFTLTLAQAVTEAVTVNYATSDGTATAGQDYTAVSNGSVTIAVGNTTAEFTVSVTGDETDELDETFNVTISLPEPEPNLNDGSSGEPAAAITGGDTAAAVGAILDDDPAVVTVATKVDTVEEGEDAVFVLTRAGVTDGPLAMQVRLRAPGRLETLDARFEPGAATAEIAVATDDNNLVDYPSVRDYTIEVFGDGESLDGDDQVFTPGAPATATVKATDDEELINVTVRPRAAAISGGNPYYIFRRDGDISQRLTIRHGFFVHRPGYITDAVYDSDIMVTFEADKDEVEKIHDFTFDEGVDYPPGFAGSLPITLTYVVFGDGGRNGLNRIYQGGDPNAATVTMYYNGNQRGLVVGAEAPLQVSVGQTVSIPLTVTNTGSQNSRTPITITSTHYSRDTEVNGDNEPRMACRIDGPIAAGASAGCEVSFLVQERDLNPGNYARIELDVTASDGLTTSNAFRIYMRVRDGVSVGFKEADNRLLVTEPGFGEANARANLTVTRVGQSSEEVQVAYTLEPWPTENRPYPPVEGVDYADNSATPGVITFGKDETEKTITIDILGDQIDEAREQFRVTLVPPEGVLVEEDKKYRLVVINDATPPPGVFYRPKATLELVSSGPVPESEGPVEFAVVLDRVWGIDARYEVDLLPDQLTATPGIARLGIKGDFEDPGVVFVRIPAGQTRFEFSVPLYDDDVREEDETFQLLLGSSLGNFYATIVTPYRALATIADDDYDRVPPTEVALSLSHKGRDLATVPEGSNRRDITVTASFPRIHWPGDASNAPLRPADPRDVDTTVRVQFDPNSGSTHAAGPDDFEPLEVEDDQGAFGEVESFEIVIPAGQTSGAATLRFRTVKDDVDEEDETVTLLGSELVAGDPDDSLPVRSASFIIIDDDTRGITISPESTLLALFLVEGGEPGTYSLVLDSQPTDTVVIALAGNQGGFLRIVPDSLTFTTSDWATPQTISVMALDDGIAGGVPPTNFVTHQVSGGDYGSVTAPDISAYIEDTTQAFVYLDDAQASESDGHLEFTVTVRPVLRTTPVLVRYATVDGTAIAGSDYTREVETGQTYKILNIPAGRSSGTIRIPVTDDQVYESADETFTLQLTNHNDKALLDGEATSLTATGAIADDDPKPVVSVAGPAGAVSYVSENAKDPVTFTLTLMGQSAGDVTVDYATGEAGLVDLFTARQGLTRATEDEDYAGTSGTVTFTSGQTTKTVTVQVTNDDVSEETEFFGFKISTPQGADLRGQRSEDVADVGLLDDDPRGVTIGPTSVGLDEPASGETAVAGAYTVNLNSKPVDTVTVTIGGGAPAVSLSGHSLTNSQLTFTTTNWNTAQTITVTPVKDDNAVGETITLTHTLSGGDYAGIAADSVTVNLTDSDTRNMVLSKQSLTVTEGDATGDRYTVKLATQPSDTVTVTVSGHDGADLTLSGTRLTNNQLTFTTTNWDVAQTVTVEAGQDNDGAADTATLTHTASGGDYFNVTKDLPVTVTDDDAAAIVLSETDLTLTEGDAAGTTYTVSLATQPSDTVTVTISGHEGADLTLSGTTLTSNQLTFTNNNWDVAQPVTVEAGQDNDDANDTATLTHTASGGDYAGITADLPVTITDDDNPFVEVQFAQTAYTVPEGGTQSVTVTLSADPERTVEIPIMATNQGDASSADYTVPSSVTFNADEMSKTITFTAADDTDNDDDESVLLAFGTLPSRVSAGTTAETTVSITDNDDPQVTVMFEVDAYTVAEGDTVTVTITLSADPERTVVIPLVKTDQGSEEDDYSGVPSSVTFNATETVQSFTFTAIQDEVDDDDESVLLAFGPMPDPRVSPGTTAEATVNITDDDVTLTFGPDTVTREINENSGANQNVGAPVTATYTGTGTLTYTLGGADAASFEIDSSTGQIKTRSGVTYDHEAKSTYTVTVTASDGSGGTATATVTIDVNDLNEPPIVPLEVVGYAVPRTYDQLFVRWTPPGNAGRPDITGYDIQIGTGFTHLDISWRDGPQSVDGTSAIISGLEHSFFYWVRVRAKNDEGSGPWSEPYDTRTNVLDTEVEISEPFIPDGLAPNDRFHLLFVTTPVQAIDTDIVEYTDRPKQLVINLLGRLRLAEWWQFFDALVSTRHIDARVLTNTTYTNEDKGVPIHWVGGAKAADDYEDFYDGDWDDESARNERGELVPLPNGVWTGSTADGRELMDGGTSRALGQSLAGYGAPGSTISGEGPIYSGSTAANTALKPILALSSVFRVVHLPLVANADQTQDTDDRRSAMRSQAFTTGSNRHGYEFSGVAVGIHYTETSHIEVSVYSVDGNGYPDTLLFALSNPDSYTNDTQAFDAPAGSTLDPGTPYAVVVQHATSGTDLDLYTTASDSEDDESLDGWSIADAFDIENGGSWQPEPDGKALKIIVRGIAKVGPSLAPTGLTATAVGDNRIDLSWTAPTDDGGSAITGYRIESSADGSTGWADLVADTGMAAITYSHTGLMPNTTRHYRVSAINGEGTSGPSDTANATTDYPEVTVQFGGGPYTVAEGGTQAVTVVLSEDPLQTTVIPLMATGQGGAESGDYSVPSSVTFNSGETSKPFDFTATQDDVDDDDESVRLTFGTSLPSKVSVGTIDETTVSITDDDDPFVGVQFSQDSYTAPEGGTVNVSVTLSANPERTVAIPLTATNQGSASSADYTVPSSVTFDADEMSKTITFTAADDSIDDDDESVLLGFGANLPSRVTQGAPNEATVTITDDDYPQVTVMFEADAYTVAEGDTVTVTVTLSADPERTVEIPIMATNQGSASSADYTVPSSVTFNTDEMSKTITFTAADDSIDDDDESVLLAFGTLPPSVSLGTNVQATVSINDDDSAGVSVSEASLTIDEGGSGAYTIVLDSQPTADVTITINDPSDNTDVTAEPASLTFTSTDWNSRKTVTVNAAQDADADDETAIVTHTVTSTDSSYSGASANSVSVTVTDDAPAGVTVAFGQAAYRVTEGGGVSVTVSLNEDPERTVVILLVVTNQGGASDSDYSGVPESVTFNSGDTSTSFTLTAADDTLNETGESVKIAFGALPSTPIPVTAGAPDETTVTINGKSGQDMHTPPTVHFASPTYSVAEGNTVTVTVELSKAPGSDVVIPLTMTEQGEATFADYSGVPIDVTFAAADTQKPFTFEANQDMEDDDGESVLLGFSALPDGITATTGEASQTTVTITDDDDPQVTVSFGQTAYTVPEGGTQSVTVTLSADPERTVVIPLTTMNQGGAGSTDYSVPSSVTFNADEMSKTITFTATQDTEDDDDESVLLGFGANLPSRVTQGAPNEATVTITDDDYPQVTVMFEADAYTVAEGDTVTVTVTLSADPERTVEIPIMATNQGGSSAADYSGVPASVTFDAGDTSKTFDFAATADTVDDDGESVKLAFGALPTGVTAGATDETTVSITDDDDPAVTVSFGAATYTAAEGGTATVTVTLSADPERTVEVRITTTNQNGATAADYSGVPASVTFDSGDTSKTFDFTATQDTDDDDGESVKLGFGTTLPAGVSEGSPSETTVSITDNDDPQVTVSFEVDAYTVPEGDTVTVTIALSADPERTVEVRITATNQGGATSADYSGVPATVTFNAGETSQPITFAATQDTVDDDGESVKLGFGTTLPAGVSEGSPSETTVSITDNDDPQVTVMFEVDAYTVAEGDTVTVTIALSADPERTVAIPLTATNQGSASSADYTVPSSVTFNTGEMSKTITFTATQDTEDDDDESVLLAFGTLPSRVTEGTPNEATVTIKQVSTEFSLDCAGTAVAWCANVEFSDQTAENWGWTFLQYGLGLDPPASLSDDDFRFRDVDYTVLSMELRPGTHPIMPNAWSRWQQGYSSFRIVINWGPSLRWDPSEEHYRDWVLHLDGLELPFQDAIVFSNNFTWVGAEFQQIYNDWTSSTVTKIAIEEVAAADQGTNPLLPWAPMQVDATPEGPNRLRIDWAKPAWYSPGLPNPTAYIVQWKLASASWSDSATVSQREVRAESHFHHLIVDGLTEGSLYSVRVIASNDAGDGPPSEETLGRPQDGVISLLAKTVNGRTLTLRFSERLDRNAVPAATAFVVMMDGGLLEVDSVAINRDEVTLTLNRAVTAANSVLVRYDKPTDPSAVFLRDTGGDHVQIPRHLELLRTVNVTPQSSVQPLTAQFTNMPNSHDGATLFTFDVEFSEPVWVGVGLPRDGMLEVTGGTVVSTPWKDLRSDKVTVHVRPDTRGDIVIVLPGNRVCAGIISSGDPPDDPVAGASCTIGNRMLTNEPTMTIPGPSSSGLQVVENTPAEGEPRIDGIPELGQTLSADTTAIADADGLENVVFQYQWLAEDADIAGATYTVVSGDVGKAIRVRVTFTDDGGNAETLTSAPTVVTASGLQIQSATVDGSTLTLTYSEVLDTSVTLSQAAFAVNVNGESRSVIGAGVGQSNVVLLLSQPVEAADTVTVDYTAPDDTGDIQDILGRKADPFSGQAVTNNTAPADAGKSVPTEAPGSPSSLELARHESGQLRASWAAPDSGLDPTGYTLQWKESGYDWADQDDTSGAIIEGTSHVITGLTDGVEYAVRVIATRDDAESEPSAEVTATPRETTPPVPSSAAVDGATLTLTFNEPLDAGEQPDKSTFAVTVAGNDRGVDTVSVSGSIVTITLVTAVFAGDAVTVDYTAPTDQSAARLQDLAGNLAASFGGRQAINNTQAADLLMVSVSALPSSHDGGSAFTFELRFSEETRDGFSYKTMRDHVFTVTGGMVTKARRMTPPSNFSWEIHVTPDGDGALTIVLPVTTDCTAEGAICTQDRRPLSSLLEMTVPGPGDAQQTPPNSRATGAPTITGTTQVGETLTADTTGISDADGLDDVTFAYQWLAGDAEINGATASAYTLVGADEGKAISVQVSFTDDRGNEESLTSAATGAVAPPPNTPATGAPTISGTAQVGETLTARTSNISDGDGLENATFAYQWLTAGAEINGATASAYTLVDADEGKAISVQVSFTDDRGNEESLTSAATGAVAAAPPPNTPATGTPTISGTLQVGETLTAGTTGISDGDGLGNAVFAYQWMADDAEINGATASAYTLVDADAGQAIRVRVSFTDDGGNGEELTSAATGAVAAAVAKPPLTASVRDVPSSHDGSAAFTFELRFSEELADFSYVTMRDHVFTVTGGSVTYVRRLAPPSNMRWEVHVTPDSDGSLVIVLPVTGDCEADGAICTEDGRRLSNRLEVTVNGP